ncbi:TPA: type IV secretion protein DotI, partial [Legionella pneumophila]|nr:type IV secretion protein DotI [Legionella pneumophila]
MAEDALTVVALRNKFYKDSQRKVILALLIAIVVNVVLASLVVYMITHPPAPKYFATSINGRITPLFPLDEPNQSDSAVLQWANQAA